MQILLSIFVVPLLSLAILEGCIDGHCPGLDMAIPPVPINILPCATSTHYPEPTPIPCPSSGSDDDEASCSDKESTDEDEGCSEEEQDNCYRTCGDDDDDCLCGNGVVDAGGYVTGDEDLTGDSIRPDIY